MKIVKSTALGLLVLMWFAQNVIAQQSLGVIVQERENEWSVAFNANDAERLGAFYEADAIFIPPDSQPVLGRAHIAKALSGLFPVLKNFTLTVEEVRELGENYAVEIGRATYHELGTDGSLTPGISNYQVVWHKSKDGVWRYVTDMINVRSRRDD